MRQAWGVARCLAKFKLAEPVDTGVLAVCPAVVHVSHLFACFRPHSGDW